MDTMSHNGCNTCVIPNLRTVYQVHTIFNCT